MVHYCLPEFSSVDDFLALLAKRRGMLHKGARPDVNKAAKLVLQDWNMSVSVPVATFQLCRVWLRAKLSGAVQFSSPRLTWC